MKNKSKVVAKSKSAKKSAVKRKPIRFSPDLGDYAQVRWPLTDGTFGPNLIALVLDESMVGCGLVSISPHPIKIGSLCRVTVGKLAPLMATVIWTKLLDKKVFKFGLCYQE